MSDQSIPTLDERIARVGELDLEPLIVTLTHPEPNDTGLSLAEAHRLVGCTGST